MSNTQHDGQEHLHYPPAAQEASVTPPSEDSAVAQDDQASVEKTKGSQTVKAVLKFMVAQWFFIGLAIFVVIARFAPSFAKQGGLIRAEYTIGYGAVAIIFLVSGLSMKSKDLFFNLYNWRAHITVLSLSFLITSAIIYGIASGIKAAHDGQIDDWLLVGMIITHACPTTVSSNVVMTKQAHGNDILTLCEVFVGNILGAFITPALIQMYMKGVWEFGNPSHQGTDVPISDLYKNTMKQLGLSVFIPLFVGQVVQNVFPVQTKWAVTKLYLNKVGSFCLLLIMFQSFSTAFAQHAFTSVSHVSIIFLVFFNIGLYLTFTVISYFYARPWPIKRYLSVPPDENSTKLYTTLYKIFRPFYYNRRDTVAVMLCGPAKTAALGVSLVSSQYGSMNPHLGILLVPLVLYQSEQVITAQVLVNFMRKWVDSEEILPMDHESALNTERTAESAPQEYNDYDEYPEDERLSQSTLQIEGYSESLSQDSRKHRN